MQNGVGCSVACLEWTCRMRVSSHFPRPGRLTFCRLKARLQKRLRNSPRCRGKLLGCLRCLAPWGLQCALSGNPVAPSATRRACRKGKPPPGDGRVYRRENLLDLKSQYLLGALPPIDVHPRESKRDGVNTACQSDWGGSWPSGYGLSSCRPL